ncbi:hypothetical protein OAA19_00835 [Rubripirellula sp.]|nr:hypothetical protein [Rubripirellula sp.]MDB4338632.1 hypothetical protein [Rubripirellula sp.]
MGVYSPEHDEFAFQAKDSVPDVASVSRDRHQLTSSAGERVGGNIFVLHFLAVLLAGDSLKLTRVGLLRSAGMPIQRGDFAGNEFLILLTCRSHRCGRGSAPYESIASRYDILSQPIPFTTFPPRLPCYAPTPAENSAKPTLELK